MASDKKTMQSEHPIDARYRAWSPESSQLSKRACEVFPGGDTRASAHYAPYPLTIQRGEGCYLYDVDGHQILDFMNNFTSLIHGHGNARVVDAVSKQAVIGTAYAAPSQNQIELAELIVARVGSIDQLRFCSSGTEATLMAIRCARAFTAKQKIMKMEGGYHGSYELAEVSLIPVPEFRGELERPNSLPVDGSFPDSVLQDTIVCPYNEPELAKQLIEENADTLAAVIIEPLLGSMGMIPANKRFLETLRETTEKNGVVLIFDEVISLRLSGGGAQEIYGIKPDLTCMGKIIGGGLPVGSVGGKRELMQVFNPTNPERVFHASTFSGNALTMAAGLAAMTLYTPSEAERLNRLGDMLRRGFDQALQQSGIRGHATGLGSLVNLHLTDKPLHDSRDAMEGMLGAGHIGRLLHLCMLQRGVMSASRLMYCISTPMTETEINIAITALSESLSELRPYIETERPGLLI
ncbi:MAG: aspartate aminotransferase family protein [Gammaproteobacteria bacterium]|nr:aspartate aminotransferase family protein [Gammaproteobacteria bacterium]